MTSSSELQSDLLAATEPDLSRSWSNRTQLWPAVKIDNVIVIITITLTIGMYIFMYYLPVQESQKKTSLLLLILLEPATGEI